MNKDNKTEARNADKAMTYDEYIAATVSRRTAENAEGNSHKEKPAVIIDSKGNPVAYRSAE